MSRSGKNRPSVLNWMGTLFLTAIPGVNLIFLILSAIFARSPSKRGFAVGGILLIILLCVLIFVAFMVFPAFFRDLADKMRQLAGTVPAAPAA